MSKLLLLFMFVLAATGLQAQNTKDYTLALFNEKGKRINPTQDVIQSNDLKGSQQITFQLLDKKGKKVKYMSANFTGVPVRGSVIDGTLKNGKGIPASYISSTGWENGGKLYIENIRLSGQKNLEKTFVFSIAP